MSDLKKQVIADEVRNWDRVGDKFLQASDSREGGNVVGLEAEKHRKVGRVCKGVADDIRHREIVSGTGPLYAEAILTELVRQALEEGGSSEDIAKSVLNKVGIKPR